MTGETAVIVTAALAGIGGILKLVFTHLQKKDREFTTFLSNHLSANTKAMEDTARALERVVGRLEGVEDEIRRSYR